MSKYQKGEESGHARLAVTLLRWALLTREKKRLGHCFSLSYCGIIFIIYILYISYFNNLLYTLISMITLIMNFNYLFVTPPIDLL